VVRKTKSIDELIERTRDIVMSPEEMRAQRRSSVHSSTTIANPDVTREIIARVDADFERIFGSE
jgi:hypothetical protein